MGWTLSSAEYKSTKHLALTNRRNDHTLCRTPQPTQEVPQATMIHTKLYQRVAAAYQDNSEMLKFDISLYDDPQETVDNTLMMLEYTKKRLENEEWEVLYYYGAAIYTCIMRYPGTTYAVAREF